MHAIGDLTSVNQAYTRLAEKFKTLFTFHQFLQGLHKTFLGNAPGYDVDFQALYDQVRGVTAQLTLQQPSEVLLLVQKLDVHLDGVHRQLAEDDATIPPSFVRRFFERVKTEDEKLLVAVLRFYFYGRTLPHDAVDKIDFLVTVVGARRSFDDGHFIARFPVELQKLFGALITLMPRAAPPAELVNEVVESLARIKRGIERCSRFDELIESRVLDDLRRVKHAMGSAIYTVEALSAMLEANLAAKNKFSALYEAEERRIAESSRQLSKMEEELENGTKSSAEDLAAEFQRFHELQRALEASKEKGVRRMEVRRLSRTIDTLLAKLDLPASEPASAAVPAVLDGGRSATRPGQGAHHAPFPASDGAASEMPSGEAIEESAPPGPARKEATAPERDPLLADYAAKVLSTVETMDGPGSLSSRSVSRFRLEPWEIRAARRLLRAPSADDGDETRARDLLFFESALVRMRIDDEAQSLRAPIANDLAPHLAASAQCLVRAQELDRRFRAEVDASSKAAAPDRVKEVNRSRFRLLRSFAGLWLLHDTKSGGTAVS
jgi:hypothetical protein